MRKMNLWMRGSESFSWWSCFLLDFDYDRFGLDSGFWIGFWFGF